MNNWIKDNRNFITILTIAGVWVTMFVLMSIQVFNHIPTAIDETNKRIDETNKRIDDLNRLIIESNASTNQRLDAISERLDDLYQLLLEQSLSE